MTEQPTGRLAYGQAGSYDAIDDRAVIRALTGGRYGMVTTVAAAAGSGLNVIIEGGWLGVADCGDNTSGVVGSPTEQVVQANPGPPTGTREDYVWCDVDPDEGTWTLATIPASTSAGRPGLPVAAITVPANATLASQMTIRPADALLDRRILGYMQNVPTGVSTAQTWETGQSLVWNNDTLIRPGRWYRVKFALGSARSISGGSVGPGGSYRIGVGWHVPGTSDRTAVLSRSTTISFPGYDRSQTIVCEHVFRHPITSAPSSRNWNGRMWSVGAGSFNPQSLTGQGEQCSLYTEDLGT